MSKIVNLKTIRFEIFNAYDSWYSSWFEDINYSNVLFEDLMLKNYLLGIFYKLKIPTNYFYLKKSNNNTSFLYTDLFFMKKYKKSLFKNMYKEQLAYFNYLLKYYTLYKNYYFYSYFNSLELRGDLFFSSRKIKQITFIGTSLLQKSKSLNARLENTSNQSNFYFLNNMYNRSFFYFKNKYYHSFLVSGFLNGDNTFYFNNKWFDLYLNLLYKYFNLLNFKALFVGTHVIKMNMDFLFYKKINSTALQNKVISNYTTFIDSSILMKTVFLNFLNKDDILILYILFFFYSRYKLLELFQLNFKKIKKLIVFYSANLKLIKKNSNYVNYPLIDISKTFSIIKYFKLKFYKMSYVYYEGNFKKKLTKKIFNTLFYKVCISDFILKLENTISNYMKQKIFLFFNIFYQDNDSLPNITNAKILTDYIVYSIHNQIPLRTIFKKIRNWQIENNEHKLYLENLYFKYQTEGKLVEHLNHLSFKRYPILGIRVECSGTAKKGTRKQKIFYGDWIKDFDTTTKSPNNTFSADLDYYQSFAIVKSSTLGIKVWVFFKTHLYNANNVFISLISY